jgi:hypothetical protein
MSVLRLTPEQYQAHLDKLKNSRPDAIDVPVIEKKTGLAIVLADEPVAAPQTPLQRMQALGRLKQGEMNKTEARYAAHLEKRKAAGEIVWFKFEGLKFRLADNTFLTPDFMVMLADGRFEAHDVKGGFITDDSVVKLKVAEDMYPMPFFIVQERKKKEGGGWIVTGIGNGNK